MRLPIAVAKTSTPGATRSNGVANEFGRAHRRDPDDDDLAAERLGIETTAEDLGCADAPEASLGPIETQRHVIAEVHFSYTACDLDPVGTQDRLGLQPLRGCGERERWDHAVGSFKDHRNIARNSARVGRNVRKADLRRVANGIDRPQNGGWLRRQRQVVRFGFSARRSDSAEDADGSHNSRRRLERAGEIGIRLSPPRIEEGDIDRNRLGMEGRQGPDDTRHHFARGPIASRVPERLVVNRHNDDARRRRTRPGEKKAPVEGQVFDPVQRGSETVDLQSAQRGAEDERRGEKPAGQEPGRSGPLGRHSLAETRKKGPHPGFPPPFLDRGCVARSNIDPLPLSENYILVQAAVGHPH